MYSRYYQARESFLLYIYLFFIVTILSKKFWMTDGTSYIHIKTINVYLKFLLLPILQSQQTVLFIYAISVIYSSYIHNYYANHLKQYLRFVNLVKPNLRTYVFLQWLSNNRAYLENTSYRWWHCIIYKIWMVILVHYKHM